MKNGFLCTKQQGALCLQSSASSINPTGNIVLYKQELSFYVVIQIIYICI